MAWESPSRCREAIAAKPAGFDHRPPRRPGDRSAATSETMPSRPNGKRRSKDIPPVGTRNAGFPHPTSAASPFEAKDFARLHAALTAGSREVEGLQQAGAAYGLLA